MSNQQVIHVANEQKLQQALRLIKIHISESGQQSKDLHDAVQLIVDVARFHGHCNA
jgi:hypothetical protein